MSQLMYHNLQRNLSESIRSNSISLIEKVCQELGKPDESERLIKLFIDDSIRVKKFKDKHAPKKAKSAYMCFCDQHRPQVKKSLGDKADFSSTVKKLAADWKALTDKSEYEKAAEQDKERYNAEMEKYNAALYN